jgi:hypothetical protein
MDLCGREDARSRREGGVGATAVDNATAEVDKANLHWPVHKILCSNRTAAKEETGVVRVLHNDRSIDLAKLVNSDVHLCLVKIRCFDRTIDALTVGYSGKGRQRFRFVTERVGRLDHHGGRLRRY